MHRALAIHRAHWVPFSGATDSTLRLSGVIPDGRVKSKPGYGSPKANKTSVTKLLEGKFTDGDRTFLTVQKGMKLVESEQSLR